MIIMRDKNCMKESIVKREDLIEPTFLALKKLGGSGSINEIHDKIIEILNLKGEQIQTMHTDGRTKLQYNLAWVRTYLKMFGAIDIKARGVWVITPNYYNKEKIEKNDVLLKTKNKRKENFPEKKGKSEVKIEILEANQYNWREKLIGIIKDMNPYSFEEFTKLLLRLIGFEKVEVTKKSNDKGLDGYGIFKINGLITYSVAFQCKRYTNSTISSSEIRDFRGSLSSDFDRGLFITTSTFSPSAITEATAPGKKLIELIDGKTLIDKIEEFEIGIKPKKEYEIDFEFFSKYK